MSKEFGDLKDNIEGVSEKKPEDSTPNPDPKALIHINSSWGGLLIFLFLVVVILVVLFAPDQSNNKSLVQTIQDGRSRTIEVVKIDNSNGTTTTISVEADNAEHEKRIRAEMRQAQYEQEKQLRELNRMIEDNQ
jgi:hypothetical protein